MKIQYQEHKAESVMKYFAENFQIKNGKLSKHEWFYDAAKGAVVFKLYIDEIASNPKGAGSVHNGNENV